MFKTETMKSFPPKSNPYHHDLFHMGARVDDRWEVMYPSHEDSKYIIVIDKITGERLKITKEG
jgi:hypothetical protein